MFARLAGSLAIAVAATFGTAVHAQPLTPEEVWKPPQYASPVLSRDGKYFAVSVPVDGRLNLAVLDLESNKATLLTSFKDFDVLDVTWVGNDRLVFSLGQFNSPTGPGAYEGGGLFMVSRDGKESRKLAPTVREIKANLQFVYRYLEVLATVPGNDEEILVEGNLRDAGSQDVYRINVRTGRQELLTEQRPTRTGSYVLDNERVPRVVTSMEKDQPISIVWYRKDAGSPWQELTRFDWTKGPSFVPLAFDADNRTLQVATNRGRDTMAIYRYDPDTKQLGELLAQHPRYDMGADPGGQGAPGVRLDWKSGKVVGYSVQADKPQTAWIDPAYDRIQKMIDGALPGTYNSFRRTPDGKRLIVTATSDRSAPRWYMLDEEKRTMSELFAARPWLKPERMVEQKPFTYKTRDGLEIPGYVFLPANRKPGERLPTIVHIHGGPSARADTWGRGFGVIEGQLFASHGYAVVVPNFRITPGMGGKIYYSGFGTFGRQMLDDHEDATRWAIDQGIADPGRICMSGASYGGYATLMSLARFPKTFKCGVAGLVVSDAEMILTSGAGDIARSEIGVNFWKAMIGVDSTSKIPREVSPVYLADRIKQPLFMYAGADDIRTPLEQTNAMVKALEKAGNPPKELVIKAEEGHGYGKLENAVDLYTRILKFLDQQIGPGSVAKAP